MRRLGLVVTIGALLCMPSLGRAATGSVVGGNWAGWVVQGRSFSRVAGSWRQPSVACTSATPTYSSYWLGLGGWEPGSQRIEQIGTEADCEPSGPVFYAWYELVPGPTVVMPLALHGGDDMRAAVSAGHGRVRFALSDLTTGQVFTVAIRRRHLDTGSAEWIVEDPSGCSSTCALLPLADFGSVAFTDIDASTLSPRLSGGIRRWQNRTALRLSCGGTICAAPTRPRSRAFTVRFIG